VLLPLLRDVVADAGAASVSERPLLVFLGDYVDRGPDSKGVVDLILKMRTFQRIETRVLRGNHEEALLDFLADPAFGPTWVEYGGGATLASYGVQAPASRLAGDAWIRTRDDFAAVLPADHLAFYRDLELMVETGDYAFVHAGVRPGVPLDQQTARDLLWIRNEFLQARGPFGKVIVHGHTPTETPQILPHRLGIDTGAYATGVLTAVRLLGEDQRLMQTRAAAPKASAL
jgi:serine/threonine protein phosphatase 1